jgi:hypothetical protein|tara:strand:- start:303 stop:614 length:312 start_codon:yes stop_codon:yes gene_type:complete
VSVIYTDVDLDTDIAEFLEQVNYCLSLRFKNKWRHKFSPAFIDVFQDRILFSLKKQKPIKASAIKTTYVKKHKYSPDVVDDFFRSIDLSLYRPLITNDLKYHP